MIYIILVVLLLMIFPRGKSNDGNRLSCDTCEGSGEVMHGCNYHMIMDCSNCNGHGYLIKSEVENES